MAHNLIFKILDSWSWIKNKIWILGWYKYSDNSNTVIFLNSLLIYGVFYNISCNAGPWIPPCTNIMFAAVMTWMYCSLCLNMLVLKQTLLRLNSISNMVLSPLAFAAHILYLNESMRHKTTWAHWNFSDEWYWCKYFCWQQQAKAVYSVVTHYVQVSNDLTFLNISAEYKMKISLWRPHLQDLNPHGPTSTSKHIHEISHRMIKGRIKLSVPASMSCLSYFLIYVMVDIF